VPGHPVLQRSYDGHVPATEGNVCGCTQRGSRDVHMLTQTIACPALRIQCAKCVAVQSGVLQTSRLHNLAHSQYALRQLQCVHLVLR
jgi:hypothetical protein